ncbi:Uncharacterized protein TCM_025144 [Theobroma cacao]|uniref:Uncharacterized protein n=1 Tax=Theobroma cacao TaxID=3641 RepID=A0A061EXH0_THECC|nr:Uncharacterized protein TCM_025144 [Theobroma cacao]
MQVINLMRQFEVLKMKEDEIVKDYVDKLMKIVNQVRLIGAELSDARIVKKEIEQIRLEEHIETALPARFKDKTVLESNGKKSYGDKKDKDRKPITNQEVQGEKHGSCNKLGHVKRVCKNKTNQQNQQAQVTEEVETTKELLFMASEGILEKFSETWLLDSA